ncbi:MAG: cisplatin damage response ATP-dependent DNA ligase [Pseudomonadota bacterium]
MTDAAHTPEAAHAPETAHALKAPGGSFARFAELLDRLVLTPQRNGKLKLLTDFFAQTPDPDRGYALAAVTRDLALRNVKANLFRTLIAERMDVVLFELSYDYVGDLAETVSLCWPERPGANAPPEFADAVERLQSVSRAQAPQLLESWLDALDARGRWALIKLATGGLRIGVSARLAKQALARYGDKPVEEIEELWHGLTIPYADLFAWLEGRAERPVSAAAAPFRPVMLAHPILERAELDALAPADFFAEWKWDGTRVQAACEAYERRLYSRTGDDISATFPDVLAALDGDVTLDGELLVFDPAAPPFKAAPFSHLQQRLNRKTVGRKLLETHPAFFRAYDLLRLDGEDLRPLPFEDRRRRLEDFIAAARPARVDLSPLVDFETWDDLAARRAAPPAPEIEGLMLKRRAAPYVPGRPKGEWWKWKRDPYLVDAVMLYAQRGHGKRSSLYSDYTFGVWREEDGARALVPVGKAYSGFTDDELAKLDKFVRDHTTDRFGPVRQVRADEQVGLVLEIAFEGLNRSTRHKSGVAMRFPRINRIRWDKPAAEADEIGLLEALLPNEL